MAKMRCDSVKDAILNSIEWTGTPQELLAIYDGLKERLSNNVQIKTGISEKFEPRFVPQFFQSQSDIQELSKKMPSVDQLITYIFEKPRFEHDIVEVEKKFFDKQLNTRIYPKLYRELRAKLDVARKSIEESQRGAFERKPTRHRNLPFYTFKKVNATPIDTTLQKPS
jgi:hypothetical protein